MPARNWGVTTRKGDRVYVHILDWSDPALALPKLGKPVRDARYLKDGTKVPFIERRDSVLLSLTEAARDPIDTVIVLDLLVAR